MDSKDMVVIPPPEADRESFFSGYLVLAERARKILDKQE